MTGGPQFTHYAGWQGAIAARNALLPRSANGVLPTVPWIVFTDPSVAQVGLSEPDARRQEGQLQVIHQPVERIDRAQTAGEHVGFIKLIANTGGRLLGAVVVGSAAEETINELSLAIKRQMTLGDLAQTLHAYPT